MCIRDRLYGVAIGGLFAGESMFHRATDASKAALVTLAEMPVSYTHLRAHETVLDLVCRLLLEKKKKKDKHADRHIILSRQHKSHITRSYELMNLI